MSSFSLSTSKFYPRFQYTKEQKDLLNESYRLQSYPKLEEKERLATLCQCTVLQIVNWFQNRRRREKKSLLTKENSMKNVGFVQLSTIPSSSTEIPSTANSYVPQFYTPNLHPYYSFSYSSNMAPNTHFYQDHDYYHHQAVTSTPLCSAPTSSLNCFPDLMMMQHSYSNPVDPNLTLTRQQYPTKFTNYFTEPDLLSQNLMLNHNFNCLYDQQLVEEFIRNTSRKQELDAARRSLKYSELNVLEGIVRKE
ncbi:unnamed protein product [Didymodactylos carnosus]|uniref:Homeobox domain-containing protein n=1 Tax=Didymodactylos carnosus TaxID=1234261 RepID=A0A814MDB2_9BILA|nr:unnamed protein product [Didymodactylos carnosus]CAF1076814.1 unnamed protein product [Didymodactylos carnosus]CAF3663202.1 unnamed protein product [Didymodactylos carnosus]CAF3843206.1 unnamed protein product [Didymodactylos carnosus]